MSRRLVHVDAAVHLHEAALRRCVPSASGLHRNGAFDPTASRTRLVVGVVVDDPLQPAERHGTSRCRRGCGSHRSASLPSGRHARDQPGCACRRAASSPRRYGWWSRSWNTRTRCPTARTPMRALLHLHPRRALLIGEHAAEMARAFADLVGQECAVRRGGRRTSGCRRAAAPTRARCRPWRRSASPPYFATSSLYLAPDLVARPRRSVTRTQPGSSSPLGLVRFMAVAQTIGVVQRQHGRLGLRAAMSAAVCVGLVTFYLDDLVVLHGDPHTAFAPCRTRGSRNGCA